MDELFQKSEHIPTQEIMLQNNTLWSRIKKELKNNKLGSICLILLLVVIISALLAPLSPYDPNQIDATQKFQSVSMKHWFGTDGFGRDYFTRTLYGGRVSLLVGFGSMLVSLVVGLSIGVIAGYVGGKTDKILMQIVNVFLSIPSILIMIVLNSFFKPKLSTLILIISMFSWPFLARVVRAETVSVKERDYITASRNMGIHSFKIAIKHIIPNIMGSLIVSASSNMANAIIMESSISFLGLGVQVPTASWGSMLQGAQAYMVQHPHLVIFPIIMVLFTVLSLNVLGDVLRNALDPRIVR